MIPDHQIQNMLRLLSLSTIDREAILTKYEEETGNTLTSKELDNMINKLRGTRS